MVVWMQKDLPGGDGFIVVVEQVIENKQILDKLNEIVKMYNFCAKFSA